jgi:hypothetical protein
MDEVIPQADVIFVCAPDTPISYKMMGGKQFELMKPHSYFILTSAVRPRASAGLRLLPAISNCGAHRLFGDNFLLCNWLRCGPWPVLVVVTAGFRF